MAGKPQKGNLIETLQNIRRGAFVEQLNEKLGEVVQGVYATDLKGSITIKLDISSNQEGQMKVSPSVKASVPVKPVGDAIFFGTVDGELRRDDPRQGALAFGGEGEKH